MAASSGNLARPAVGATSPAADESTAETEPQAVS